MNRIEAIDALAWLSVRKNFLLSLWREQDDSSTLALLDGHLEGALFVPVATDGSRFEPDKHKDGFYYIGNEGHERRFEDYDEALEALQNMMVPSWRRPTEGGHWTRVRGISWDRVPRDCLRDA